MTRIGGDELRSLQKEHGPSLLAYFARRIEPPEDAAVLLNELLEVVWRRASSAPAEPEELRMWMFGIARNLALSQHRGWRRRAALAERLREDLASRVPATQDERAFIVRRAVRALPEAQRELVRLVHWDGFSLTQAAQLTGVSPSTARSRYQLARRRLARELGALIDEEDPALELTR